MGLPVSRPVYKMGFIFSQGVFLGSRSGAAPSASSSFVSSPGFMSWKRRTFDLMMAYHEVLTNVKRRQPLKEVVFDVSVLHFFIVFFKRFYDEYLAFVGVFFTICWSLNLWMIFSLPNVIENLSVFVAGVKMKIKISLKLSLALFVSAIF